MIKAIIFDAFGTLFNLDQALLEHIDHPSVPQVLAYARKKQLEYTWLYSLMDRYMPFDEITTTALSDACLMHNADLSLVEELTPLYFKPQIFEDVIACLTYLSEQTNLMVGILSNGTEKMLQSGISKNNIEQYIDELFSVEAIQQFKPHPEVYAMVTKRLKLDQKEVMFVSSNQWDIAGAHNFGFQTSWVNRQNLFKESLIELSQVKTIHSLKELISSL